MSLFRREDVVVRVTGPDGEVLQEIHCEPVPFWTRLAFELRWAIAAPWRALRALLGLHSSRRGEGGYEGSSERQSCAVMTDPVQPKGSDGHTGAHEQHDDNRDERDCERAHGDVTPKGAK